MGLRQQREPFLGQALDEPDLPQRPGAVERLREDPPGQPLELVLATGAGQRGVADVEVDVEVRIIHPHRAALVERDEGQALAVARHQVQPGHDLRDELVVGGGFAVEHHAAGHMHVRGVTLQVQKRAVEPCQAVWIGHAVILTRPGKCDEAHIRPVAVAATLTEFENDLPNRLCPVRG